MDGGWSMKKRRRMRWRRRQENTLSTMELKYNVNFIFTSLHIHFIFTFYSYSYSLGHYSFIHTYTHETPRQSPENPPGIGICVWNIFLFIWHCLPVDPTFYKGQERPQRGAIADDLHISIQEITEICFLSHGIIHRIIHDVLAMKKVCAKWVPHFLTGGTQNWEWEVLNRCFPCLNRKGPNGWLMSNFHSLLWHALKQAKYGVDRWGLG